MRRPLREEAPEDQGEDGLPAVRGLLEEVQHPGGGRQPPDVIQNAVTFLRKYEAKNVLLDLAPQAEKGNLDLGGFRSGLEKFAEIDGKLLGVPVGSNSMALVIDEKVYEKAGITPEIGWTWEDWLMRPGEDQARPGDLG